MLRMSRDQVAPMKTPSIWNASTPLIAVKAAQGMNATVAALTSSAVVTTATRSRPKIRNTMVARPDSAKPQIGGEANGPVEGAPAAGADGAAGQLLGGAGEAVEEIAADQEEVHRARRWPPASACRTARPAA